MSFLSLSAFWFALTLPVVVLLYLLKRRRKLKLVSSTVLWERFLAESQANAPFQKLRRNLLLILQLLMLLLAVLALGRPYFSEQLSGGSLQVLILDTSASMQSVDVKPSRFEAARTKALELIDGLRDSDQMVVVAAGARTSVLQSPTSEKAVLRRILREAEVGDGPTRLLDALQLAQTLVRDHPSSEIHLLSDGAVSDLGDFEDSDLNIRYYAQGSIGNNVGLVSMDVRPNPEDATTRAIFSNVVNFSTNRFDLSAELRLDGQMVEVRRLSLDGGSSLSLAFIARQQTNGVFSLQLDVPDDLAVDNQAQVVSILPKPAQVTLYSPGNNFLERALRSTGALELQVTDDLTQTADDSDVVILDGIRPLTWPDASVLAIHTMNTNWFSNWETQEAPAIVDWKSSHPLLRFVSFDDVQIAETYAVKTPFWGAAIVESSQTPLVIAGEQGGQRRLWVGFDTLESTWPLRVSFPMFMANAIRWLNPAATSSEALNIRTGNPVRLGFEEDRDEIRVLRPGDESETIEQEPATKSLVYANTLDQGVYRAEADGESVVFAANLMDAAESDTTPRLAITVGGGQQIEASTQTRADLEVWRWVALAALLVLMFEWWWYHKRTA